MRTRNVYGLLAAAITTLASSAWILAGPQSVSPDPIVTNRPSFRIPFDWDRAPAHGEAIAAQLHVSPDGGRTWRLHEQVSAPQAAFHFEAPGDGEYWFVVRTVDNQGRFWPDASPPASPELRVVVDRSVPQLGLSATRAAGNNVHIRWNATDAQLVPGSLAVEYAVGESRGSWHPVTLAPWQHRSGRDFSSGEALLQLTTAESIALRASIRDTAGNLATAEAYVPRGQADDRSPIVEVVDRDAMEVGRTPTLTNVPPGVVPLMVNSCTFELDYDLEAVGAGDVSRVEVWGTRDGGRNWVQLGIDDDLRSPCPVQVDGEGLYGFAIVVESRQGVRGRTPAPGDVPDIWVGVDVQPPSARLTTAEPAFTTEGPGLRIKWQANDAALASDGISLFYAARSQGPWLPLATGLANGGEHVCAIDGIGADGVFLRLEARDLAGNLTVFSTTQAIDVGALRNQALRASQGADRSTAASQWYHVLR